MADTRQKYTPAFKADAVRQVQSASRPVAEIARGLGVNPRTLRGWVASAEREAATASGAGSAGAQAGNRGAPSGDEAAAAEAVRRERDTLREEMAQAKREMARLEEENRRLQAENERLEGRLRTVQRPRSADEYRLRRR